MSNTADTPGETVDKKKAKRDKVRSAWISFAGRIVAQIVGAVATVALGVMVLHRYTATDARPPAVSSMEAGQPPVHVIVITPAMMGLRDGSTPTPSLDRSCVSAVEAPATSAAHLSDSGAFGVR